MRFIKYILFILFISVLFIEVLQHFHKFIDAPVLQGNIVNNPKPVLSLDNWLSGKYQDSLLKNYESKLSMHNFLIRLHNQIDYSVFGKINVREVEEGKNHYLFGSSYSQSFFGKDYVGEDSVMNTVKRLGFIQQVLKKRKTELICIIVPGKSSYMPENIPSEYDLSSKMRSNYDAYAELLPVNNIQHIDMVKHFLKLKASAKYPLFTQGGIHWSGYGSTLAADTLFSYMEKLKHIDIKDFYTDGGEETTIPRNTDGDISNAMNLLYDIPFHKMYYPNIRFKNDSSKISPNVLIIGDSFIWSWINFYDYFQNVLGSKSDFWYYGAELGWPADLSKPMLDVGKFDFKQKISNRDFIIIECNEAKLYNFGFGFIEKLYHELQSDSLNTL